MTVQADIRMPKRHFRYLEAGPSSHGVQGESLVPPDARGSTSLSRGQSLVPPYTRGSVSLSILLYLWRPSIRSNVLHVTVLFSMT
jgi:hypothetical protein